MAAKEKLTVYVPEDLHAKLKAEASRDDRSLNAVAIRALRAYYKEAA